MSESAECSEFDRAYAWFLARKLWRRGSRTGQRADGGVTWHDAERTLGRAPGWSPPSDSDKLRRDANRARCPANEGDTRERRHVGKGLVFRDLGAARNLLNNGHALRPPTDS